MGLSQRGRTRRVTAKAGGFGARTGRSVHRPDRGARRRAERRAGAGFRPRSRGGEASRCGVGARRAPAAARRARHDQGILQRCRIADDLGHTCGQGLHPSGRRACREPPQGGGRNRSRQDQCASRPRRRAKLQRHLRDDEQSVGQGALAGRLLGRVVRRARGGFRSSVARQRHRRLAARSGAFLRSLRPQADL